MKKTLFSILALTVFASVSNAQSTLTAANFNPVAGDVYYGYRADTNGVTKGASGANQVWDFTALTATPNDTTTFLACSAALACDSFVGANLASTDGYDTSYLITSASKYSLAGVKSGSMLYRLSNPQDFIKYPFTYNTVVTDTSYATVPAYYASHRGIDSFVCDGYGLLKLPGRNDTNVLRIHMISYSYDTVFGMSAETRSERYVWVKPGFHSPLLSIEFDTTGSTSPYVTDVTYYTGTTHTTLNITDMNATNHDMKLYPNPATEMVVMSFHTTSGSNETISITDVTGRSWVTVPSSQIMDGNNSISVSTKELPSGIYLVKRHGQSGDFTTKLVIGTK